MAILEDLKPNAQVKGIHPSGPVIILSVLWHGTDVVEVAYRDSAGKLGNELLCRKAKDTSVEGLVEAAILEARAGKVRLLRRDQLDPDWDPQKNKRPTVWEACQHLIYNLEKGGEQSAAPLLAKLGSLSETSRDLAYRLYTICERKGWAQDALGYNMLVVTWPRIREQARKGPRQESFL